MRIRYEDPSVFEVSNQCLYSKSFRQTCTLCDLKCKQFQFVCIEADFKNIQTSSDHLEYVQSRMMYFRNGLLHAETMTKDGLHVSEGGSECESLYSLIRKLTTGIGYICDRFSDLGGDKLWDYLTDLKQDVDNLESLLQSFHLPQRKSNIKQITDAGQGVACSNREVKFRQTEIFLIEDLDRLCRNYTARHDSGLNPSERLNASIGRAVADGGTIFWDYYQEHSAEEIEPMTSDELCQAEKERMESNCWEVCKDLKVRINDAPAPTRGYIHCYVSERKDGLFFSDTDFLQSFIRTGKGPGSHYYSMLEKFLACHTERGELFMEVIKCGCRTKTGNICEKREERGWRGPSLTRIPKQYPDRDAGHYFSVAATSAINRTVDDCLPRSQMKRLFEEGKIGVDTIGDFCKEYLVDERVAQDYLNHLQMLSAKVVQRKQ